MNTVDSWLDNRRARGILAVFVAVVLSVVALAMVATLAGIRPAEAAFPGTNGKIVFQSNRHVASGEIYAITPGGTAARITVSNGSSNPAYSPDGSKIAFVSTNNQVFIMNSDGSGRRQITTSNTAKTEPTWSADGSRIAYVSNSFDVDGQTDLEIWAIKADGTGRTQLTNNAFPDTQPAWSPRGDRLAFVSTRTGDTDRNVYVMDADGTDQGSVTANSPPGCSPDCYQGHDDNPSWSPDGLKIAYIHGQELAGGGLPNIWTMDPNGANKRNVSKSTTVSYAQPAWSPRGDRFVAVGATDPNRNIYVMNSDGTGQAPIDTNAAHDIAPDWQPVPQCTNSGATTGNDIVTGTTGKDVLCGLGGNDSIRGLGGNDILLGGPGNDTLSGGLGNDIANGESGMDAADYSASATGVIASLTTEFATGEGTDTYSSVERLSGSGLADTLTGSGGANILKGLGGNDTLKARDGVGGNDTVDGGAGSTDTCQKDAGDTARNCP